MSDPAEPAVERTLALLRRVKARDQGALAELFEEHEDLMRGVVRRRMAEDLRRGTDTDDLLQSTFITAAKNVGELEFEDARAFRAWLARVIMSKLQERRRRLDRAHGQWVHETRALTADLESHAEPRPDSQQITEEAELLSRMYERIHCFERDDRTILLARIVHNRSWAQISEATGLAPGTVSRRFETLRDKLVRSFR